MGVGYYKPVTTWSKGEYAGATQTQDDLAVMTDPTKVMAQVGRITFYSIVDCCGTFWQQRVEAGGQDGLGVMTDPTKVMSQVSALAGVQVRL